MWQMGALHSRCPTGPPAAVARRNVSGSPLRTTYFQLWADFGELPHVLTDFFYVPVIVFRRDVIQGRR